MRNKDVLVNNYLMINERGECLGGNTLITVYNETKIYRS